MSETMYPIQDGPSVPYEVMVEQLAVAVTALEKCANALRVRTQHVVYTSECQCNPCRFELMAREAIKAYEAALRFLGEEEGK